MNFSKFRRVRGQALVEAVLALPLLLLLAAGVAQFSQLFLARVQFEHACGEAARRYVAGKVDANHLGDAVWDNLGVYQPLFDRKGVQVAGTRLSPAASSYGLLPVEYGGQRWTVTAVCKATPLFGLLWKGGVPFKTRLAALRHPT